jgi:hypothetical protein
MTSLAEFLARGCLLCGEPTILGEPLSPSRHFDQDGVEHPVHEECGLRNVAGHLFGGCDCHMPGATYREQARTALLNARSRQPAG